MASYNGNNIHSIFLFYVKIIFIKNYFAFNFDSNFIFILEINDTKV